MKGSLEQGDRIGFSEHEEANGKENGKQNGDWVYLEGYGNEYKNVEYDLASG